MDDGWIPVIALSIAIAAGLAGWFLSASTTRHEMQFQAVINGSGYFCKSGGFVWNKADCDRCAAQ